MTVEFVSEFREFLCIDDIPCCIRCGPDEERILDVVLSRDGACV